MQQLRFALLVLSMSFLALENAIAQGTWTRILGPPHGRANRTQVNTRIASDRKWRIAVIGYQTSSIPFAAEILNSADSLSISQGQWSSQGAEYDSDSLSSLSIDKPMNLRVSSFARGRGLFAGFFPIGVSMTQFYSSGGPLVSGTPMGISDIATESDSTWVCAGVDKVVRLREREFDGVWTTLFTAPLGTRFYAIAARGSNIYAAGLRQRLYRSRNRGLSFALANTGISTTANIWDLAFPTIDTGYAATSEGVYATYDSGSTWQQVMQGSMKEVSFYSAREGFALSDTGTAPVFMTQDAGQTWQVQPIYSSTARFTPYGKIVSLSATREGHCYVLLQRPPDPGNTGQLYYDSLYYFRNARPRIVSTEPSLAQSQSTLSIHPNPATGTVWIEGILPKQAWQIISPLGQKVAHGQGPQPINTHTLAKGVYLVIVEDKNRAFISKKLVVE